jgi:CBS domain-containing protein
MLCVLKLVSWAVSLGSGTSGGTLAPLFTIGGAMGALAGTVAAHWIPSIDPRIAALVGMASVFAGASRALLASVVFAFETTLQPSGILPLLGGCAASYLVSSLLMSNSIMTEKIVRRGTRVPAEYSADFLDQVLVRDACSKSVVCLGADQSVADVRSWINSGEPGTSHQGFPITSSEGYLVGVLTRRVLLDPAHGPAIALHELLKQPPKTVYDDCTCREAADQMVRHNIGRLPVIARSSPHKIVGIITRSDLLFAHRHRLDELHEISRTIRIRLPFRRRGLGESPA